MPEKIYNQAREAQQMRDDNIQTADDYKPSEIAQKVETIGVAKADMSWQPLFVLSLMAGAFIAFGGAFFTTVITGSSLGLGLTKLVGGVAFSCGLIMVIIGGAELFTGNNMIVMAWVSRKIRFWSMIRNWVLVYTGNLFGAISVLLMVDYSGIVQGDIAETAVKIAEKKVALGATEAFIRGVLCNTLICMAVWLCYASRHVIGKIFSVIFPVSAFITLDFENSIANMYLIPMGFLAGSDAVTFGNTINNLVPVTLGNIIGGSGFVAFTYWIVYLRKEKSR